uniref:Uncharacterized protein n=1 Tax=Timema monikensis TaxID=170555 RepID=A0A7R9HQ05_9NEOP|nr:unnamed protein product [Timema monikensis]
MEDHQIEVKRTVDHRGPVIRGAGSGETCPNRCAERKTNPLGALKKQNKRLEPSSTLQVPDRADSVWRYPSTVQALQEDTTTMQKITTVLLSCVLVGSVAHPLKYDQRQEGEYNIHAHLENFIIVLIPSSGSSGINLLDFTSKNARPKSEPKRNLLVKSHHAVTDEEEKNSDQGKEVSPTKEEIKAAVADLLIAKSPYKAGLDVKSIKVPLQKEVPHQQQVSSRIDDEGPMAQSPEMITLKADGEKEDANPSEPTTAPPSLENIVPAVSEEKGTSPEESSTKDSSEESSDESSGESLPEEPAKEAEGSSEENKRVKTGKLIDFSQDKKLSEVEDKERSRLKQLLGSGLEPCSRGGNQGLCQHSPRSGQRSGQWLLPALQFGLSPAD